MSTPWFKFWILPNHSQNQVTWPRHHHPSNTSLIQFLLLSLQPILSAEVSINESNKFIITIVMKFRFSLLHLLLLKLRKTGSYFEKEKWKLFYAFPFFRRHFQGQEKVFLNNKKKLLIKSLRKGIYFRCRGRSRRKHFRKRRLTFSRMTFLSGIMEIFLFSLSFCHGSDSFWMFRVEKKRAREGGHLVNTEQNGAGFNHAQIKVQSVRCYVMWSERKMRKKKLPSRRSFWRKSLTKNQWKNKEIPSAFA